MRRFVEGTDRAQGTLFPDCLEDWICENNPVRAVDVFVFVDELDLAETRVRWGRSRSHGPPFLSSIGTAEALHLRLPHSGSVEPSA